MPLVSDEAEILKPSPNSLWVYFLPPLFQGFWNSLRSIYDIGSVQFATVGLYSAITYVVHVSCGFAVVRVKIDTTVFLVHLKLPRTLYSCFPYPKDSSIWLFPCWSKECSSWEVRALTPLLAPSTRPSPPCPPKIPKRQCKLPWGESDSAPPYITAFRPFCCNLVWSYSERLSVTDEEAKTQQGRAICSNPHG